jgi:hypothetical protein
MAAELSQGRQTTPSHPSPPPAYECAFLSRRHRWPPRLHPLVRLQRISTLISLSEPTAVLFLRLAVIVEADAFRYIHF